MAGEPIQVRVQIEGRVQGVSYRAFAAMQAERLGVRGWVRNCPDGTVEAVVQGPAALVEAMIDWCHLGSPGARVLQVRVRPEPLEPFQGFEVRR